MAFVIFGYYRILAVGLKFAGLSGVMAPNAQGQGQTQKANAPAPGAFSGGAKTGASQGGAVAKLPRGRDWQVTVREFNGKTYYNLVVKPGIRGTLDILREAVPAVHEWVSRLPVKNPPMVSLTLFMGRARQDKNGRKVWPKLVILVGRGGVAVQVPNPIIIGRMWDILTVINEINSRISPYDFSNPRDDDEGKEFDDFNPPEDSSE